MDAKLLIYGTLSVETTDGCDSVAVSTVGCGPAGPGSSPGHGPISFSGWPVQVLGSDVVPHLIHLYCQIFTIFIPNSCYQGHPLLNIDSV